MRFATSLALIALLPLTSAQAATTYTVTSTADSGPGSLRAAIQLIANNTGENVFTIAFAVGSNQTIAVNSNLSAIGRSGAFVTINGAGSPGLQIDGLGTSRLLFSFENALFSVRDLTLTRGFAMGGGCLRSGVGNAGASPMIVTRVLFLDCAAGIEGGGAIYAGNQLNVSDSVFVDNRVELPGGFAGGGGAISKGGAGNLIVEGSTFIDNRVVGPGAAGNSTPVGGAIYIGDGSLNHSVRDSWFSGNLSANPGGPIAGYGGAIHLEDGALLVERSFFRGNQADREGGSISMGAFVNATATRELRVRNSTFETNTAPTGGVIAVSNFGGQSGVLDIRNSLFQRNESGTGGGHSLFIRTGAGSLNLSHNAFGAQGLAGTSPGSHCVGTATTHNANAALQGASLGCGASVTTVSTLGLIGSEPSLPAGRPVAYAMTPISPLVDAGVPGAGSIADPAACLTTDALGVSRPQSGIYGGIARCDIGPVELIGPMFRDGFED